MTYTGGPGNNFASNGDDDTYAPFDRARWKRVGASKTQLADLARVHAAMAPVEQASEGRRVASVSDTHLRDDLATPAAADIIATEQTDDLVNTALEQSEPVAVVGTVEEVLAHVAGDADRAADALAHELANKNRVSLTAALSAIAESDD